MLPFLCKQALPKQAQWGDLWLSLKAGLTADSFPWHYRNSRASRASVGSVRATSIVPIRLRLLLINRIQLNTRFNESASRNRVPMTRLKSQDCTHDRSITFNLITEVIDWPMEASIATTTTKRRKGRKTCGNSPTKGLYCGTKSDCSLLESFSLLFSLRGKCSKLFLSSVSCRMHCSPLRGM